MSTEQKHIDAGSSGQWGWHATELAMRCPRLFAYSHRIDSEGGDSDRPALLKGSLVHQGLAHHYARRMEAQQGGDPNVWAAPDAAIDACAEKLGKYASQYVDLAKAATRAYSLHWMHEKLQVMHVEEVFSSTIGGYKFTQRFDLVARDETGKVFIIDHKTTGRLTSGTPERYTLSGQFLGMAMFGRQIWGDQFGGVKMNFIEIPSGAQPRFQFMRMEPDPAPSALRSFPLTVLHARQRIEQLDASGIPPKEWPMALSEQTCITAYGPCEHFDTCRWGSL